MSNQNRNAWGRMLKIALVPVLIVILAMGVFAGGATDDAAEEVMMDTKVNPAGVFPIVDEPVTLEVFCAVPPQWVEDMATNGRTVAIEDFTGVDFEWIVPSVADAATKMNLLLASQDLPDVFMRSPILTTDQVIVYGEQGTFIPLEGLIEEYGVELKKLFDYNPAVRSEITMPDGHIYSLPAYVESTHSHVGQKMFINTDWLDALGLSMPTTVDEYYDVLVAFRDGDPNGNGEKDEIPYLGVNPVHFLMDPFVLTDSRHFLIMNGDTVAAAYADDGFREGLTFLNKLYTEGLMDPESFTLGGGLMSPPVDLGQLQAQVKQLVEREGGTLVGSINGMHYGEFCDLSQDTKLQYDFVAPLAGPDGERRTPHFMNAVQMGSWDITSAAENPAVAYRVADLMYSDRIERPEVTIGTEGISWRAGEPGEKSLAGTPLEFTTTLPWGGPPNNDWWPNLAVWQWKKSDREAQTRAPAEGEWGHEFELWTASNEFEKYIPWDELVPNVAMSSDKVREYSEINTTITAFVDESIVAFVTGRKDISSDSDWNSYMKELDNIGLQRLLEIYQSAVDAQ